MSLSFHQDPPGDDHIIYRFTSVRLATIISYHLSFHQRQTGDDHFISFIVSRASDWRRSYHVFIISPGSTWRRSYHLSFHQRQTGDDHFISFTVSPASDWRRSSHIIYRFTSVRLATIISLFLLNRPSVQAAE
ncbi:hypothetical protein P8452_09452 [Trifolium repens]|nr:hypothetical protein P8452_09452 [Trifolium repens]